ncbi:hypothetical protein [Hanstruepera marina]|nr:hypothetical protein [Hanstruepera marina]
MKKNLLGAIVIFFVTFAFLLVIKEVSNTENASDFESTEFYAED